MELKPESEVKQEIPKFPRVIIPPPKIEKIFNLKIVPPAYGNILSSYNTIFSPEGHLSPSMSSSSSFTSGPVSSNRYSAFSASSIVESINPRLTSTSRPSILDGR